jgi:hypothetical protein
MTMAGQGPMSSVGRRMARLRFLTPRDRYLPGQARIAADLYASGCSVLAAVTFPDQVVL